ncbi:MAG: ABC transporter ATP-binding protein [Methanospirillaceae archaeon]|nr:ABC transporter ATP-binding protein [Methanospirillaceae archaeon]
MGKVVITDVSRRFFMDDKTEFLALDSLSLTIKDDELVSLVGPSGCGKTTLLRIIAGLDHPDSGSVSLDNILITKPGPRVGMVFQEYSLFPWRNILDNVAFGLEMKKTGRKERYRQAQYYIDLVGLTSFTFCYPYELSGGMRQRVAIARALANDPDLLLMDEPFGALDAQTRNTMQEELLQIWEKQKKTIIFVTHSVDEAVYLSDRIVVLSSDPGRVSTVIDVSIPRPRDRTSPEFASIRRDVLRLLTLLDTTPGKI